MTTEKKPRAKLTPADVAAIRARRAGLRKYQRGPKGSAHWEIARDYRMSPMHIANICQGLAWRET